MDSQQTNRFNEPTERNIRRQQADQRRDASVFDNSQYYVIDNPTYGTAQTAPAHAYTINRAYNGRPVSRQSQAKGSQSYNAVSKRSQLKEYHSKRLRHFQLYVALVIGLAIIICLAFGLGFGLGLRDDKSDPAPSSRLQNQDPNKTPDVVVSVIVEDRDWDPALTNTQSSNFLTLADITERSMDSYFGKSSMAEIYDYAVVSSFWQGSVGTDAGIYLKSPTPNSSQDTRDIYTSIHNTSGERIIAENLYIGQDAFSTQPLTNRVLFKTDSLKIKAVATTVSSVTEASTVSLGIGSSNTTLGTSTASSATKVSGMAENTTVSGTTEATLEATTVFSVSNSSGMTENITPSGTTETTQGATTVSSVSNSSGMTDNTTVSGTTETTLEATTVSSVSNSSGMADNTTFSRTTETTLGPITVSSVSNASETTENITVSGTTETTLEITTVSSLSNSSGMTENPTVSETPGSTIVNGTPTPTTNQNMRYELVGGDDATYGYVKVTVDLNDGLLCSTRQHTDAMATYLCREINSTFYGGLILQADVLQKPVIGNVWQVEAYCYRPETDSVFSDCVQSAWKFLQNVTIYSNSKKDADEQQPFMPDSMECPLSMRHSTTEIPEIIPESTPSETCLLKVDCHSQPVDIYQEPNSNAGYVISTNTTDPQVFCRDNFTDTEAAAACKTLGYMKGGTSLTFNPIPWFNSRIWRFSNFDYKCIENATIYNCSKTEIDVTQRVCSGPAVIKCVEDAAAKPEWDVKLDKDGNTVLLYYKGQWGTICNEGTKHPWTIKEATVVCKQLNYTNGVPLSVDVIPAVSLPHVITSVTCSEGQTKLADCAYSEVKDDSCNSSYAVSVFCYNSTDVATLDLSSGSEFNSGLVKVTREDKEGYLCSGSLPSKAVTVMCRSFGFVSGVQDNYTNSTDPHLQYIWQTDLNGQCTINDVLAETCRSAAWILHPANLSLADRKCVCNDNYVSVYCYGKVKLSVEPRTNYGPLLIYDKSDYKLICHEDVDQQTATAACREIYRLNTSEAVIFYPGTFVQKDTAKNAVFNCTKDATSLADCVTFSSGINLKCKQTSILCHQGTDRPGPAPENATEWRIEESVVQVKAYGIWGTVCSDGWTNTEATALCKTVNGEYTIGISKVSSRAPTVPMWISSVTCGVNTTNINTCSRKTFLESLDYCTLGGIAQTFCFKGEDDVPRFTLADVEEAAYYVKGHLAVTRNNQRGYLCSQDVNQIESNFDALCRIMGYRGGQRSHVTVVRNDVNSTWNGTVDCNYYTPDCFLNGQFTQWTNLNRTGIFTTQNGSESESSTSNVSINACGDLHVSDILCYNAKVRLQDPELLEGFLLIGGQNGWQALCSENCTVELASRFCTDTGYQTGTYTARSASDASLTAGFGDIICTDDVKFKDCTFKEIPSDMSYRCNEIVYIACTKSTNITTGSQSGM